MLSRTNSLIFFPPNLFVVIKSDEYNKRNLISRRSILLMVEIYWLHIMIHEHIEIFVILLLKQRWRTFAYHNLEMEQKNKFVNYQQQKNRMINISQLRIINVSSSLSLIIFIIISLFIIMIVPISFSIRTICNCNVK